MDAQTRPSGARAKAVDAVDPVRSCLSTLLRAGDAITAPLDEERLRAPRREPGAYRDSIWRRTSAMGSRSQPVPAVASIESTRIAACRIAKYIHHPRRKR